MNGKVKEALRTSLRRTFSRLGNALNAEKRGPRIFTLRSVLILAKNARIEVHPGVQVSQYAPLYSLISLCPSKWKTVCMSIHLYTLPIDEGDMYISGHCISKIEMNTEVFVETCAPTPGILT